MKRKRDLSYFQQINRFFNPQKSGTNAEYNFSGLVRYGTHKRDEYYGSHAVRFIPNKVINGVIQPHIGDWL